jgi:hypothetical protein
VAIATYKDLCIDAVDPGAMADFWASALALKSESAAQAGFRLAGASSQDTVWINRVAEPKAVKHRVHIDVNTSSVAELTAVGATVIDADSFQWTVMADPEGGEFCAFLREGVITQRLYELGVDSVEPASIAGWWAEVLGGRLVHDERGFSYVDHIPGAPMDSIDFVQVPEPKVTKNRIHVDVTGDVPALVEAGANVLRPEGGDISWTVLADPEGNEFCAFRAESPAG